MKNLKNKIQTNKKYFIFLNFLIVLTLGFLFVSPVKSNAQANLCPLLGWAWSGYTNPEWGYITTGGGDRPLSERLEGMGWLSFSGSTPSGTPYRVVKNNDGTLVGYAWSSDIGWVRFGGLVGPFPGGGYVARDNAKIETNNKVTGWARACAVFVSDCTGTLAPAYYRGGWDGWIALSGGTGAGKYGVTYAPSNNELAGWAWGGDMVGWISFRDGQNYGVTLASGNQCNLPNIFDYTASVNPNLVPLAFPSSSWVGTMPAASSVVITHTSGTAEDLKILNIVPNPIYQWPTGVSVTYQGIGTVCPNASCTPLPISVNLTFDGSYRANNPTINLIRFIVTVDNHPDPNRSPSAKNIDFVVSVDSSGTGGNQFDYTVAMNPVSVLITPPQTGQWSTPVNSVVEINHTRGTAEDVRIVSITQTSPSIPGITISNVQGGGEVCPGASCDIGISMDVAVAPGYVRSGTDSITFRVTVVNVVAGPPDEKEAFFNVVINNPSSPNECTVSPNMALIGQSVTWQAPSNNLNVSLPSTYAWFYQNNNINSFGNGQSRPESYSTLGTRTAYVRICDSVGSGCVNSDVCHVRIVTIPEFEQR